MYRMRIAATFIPSNIHMCIIVILSLALQLSVNEFEACLVV